MREWTLYLLVDPTVPPSNHPAGEVFYVGVGSALGELRSGRNGSDLSAQKAIPDGEPDVFERIVEIQRKGESAHVQMVMSSSPYSSLKEARHTVDTVVSCMYPTPLNILTPARAQSQLNAQAFDAVGAAREVRLPEGIKAIVYGIAPSQSTPDAVEDAKLIAAKPAELLESYTRLTDHSPHNARIISEVNDGRNEGAPYLFILAVRGFRRGRLMEPGFILGVWTIARLRQSGRSVFVEVAEDDAWVMALRRQLLNNILTDEDGRRVHIARKVLRLPRHP